MLVTLSHGWRCEGLLGMRGAENLAGLPSPPIRQAPQYRISLKVTHRRQQCEIWSYSPANYPVICPQTGQAYNS